VAPELGTGDNQPFCCRHRRRRRRLRNRYVPHYVETALG